MMIEMDSLMMRKQRFDSAGTEDEVLKLKRGVLRLTSAIPER